MRALRAVLVLLLGLAGSGTVTAGTSPDGPVVSIAFVGDVVRTARKDIDRLYRLAQMRGQQQGRDREVLVMVDRHA